MRQIVNTPMFVTDQLTPAEILSELLARDDVENEETKKFRSLRHDRDLCPKIRENAVTALSAYKSHRADVHITQGLRDDGIDVLLRYKAEEERTIGLQIKSFDEFEKWANGRDSAFLQRLKAQAATAILGRHVEKYHIVLCTDGIHHRQEIMCICSEMREYERTNLVLPRNALSFYELDGDEIGSLTTRLLSRRDSVYQAAHEELSRMQNDTAYLYIRLLSHALEGNSVADETTLDQFYNDWLELTDSDNDDRSRLGDILSELNGSVLDVKPTGGDHIELSQFGAALCSIYFDLKERGRQDLPLSLVMLFGLTEAFS